MGNLLSAPEAPAEQPAEQCAPAPVPQADEAPFQPAAAPKPQGAPPPDKFLIVENEHIKIGVDPTRGGGICWLGDGSNQNVLNEYDCGRFIQQSYYGKEDGSDWNGKPWRWNPVQCGSWQNRPARVLACKQEKPCHLVTEVNPRNWAGQQLCDDVTMRADIQVSGKHAHIKFTMRYTGSEEHPVRIQELPAVFLTRKLGRLVFYEGPEPWKGKVLTTKEPGSVNENYRITENWAAFIDPATGEGVGVYTPIAETITCYRVGQDGSCACHDCSYLAPTMRFSVKPGMEMTYHCFIMLGTVEAIRKEFSDIRGWAANNRPEMLSCAAMADATPAI